MRVLSHMLAPLWAPFATIYVVLLIDSPLVRLVTFLLVVAAWRLVLRYALRGAGYYLGYRTVRSWIGR